MIPLLERVGERVLDLLVPGQLAAADDYCRWETRCGACYRGIILPAKERRLCCTSQDGSYCLAWEDVRCGWC
jgi:hypothetical protein